MLSILLSCCRKRLPYGCLAFRGESFTARYAARDERESVRHIGKLFELLWSLGSKRLRLAGAAPRTTVGLIAGASPRIKFRPHLDPP